MSQGETREVKDMEGEKEEEGGKGSREARNHVGRQKVWKRSQGMKRGRKGGWVGGRPGIKQSMEEEESKRMKEKGGQRAS